MPKLPFHRAIPSLALVALLATGTGARAQLRDSLDEAGEKARGVGEKAGEKARDLGHKAEEKARGLGEKAANKAEAALERAREIGHEAAVKAQDKVERAKEVGREAAQEAEVKVEAAGERVREVAAEVGERLRAARRAAFDGMDDRVDRPSDIPPPARAELKLHARRIAELQRIRSLAQQKGDLEAKQRSEELIAREHSRHDRRMGELLRRSEKKSDEERDEPSAEPEREEDKGGEP